ncbi:MAG: DHA2 family efflux MFS transporter permease subunit [Patescibacteria group bacterium]
MKKQSPWLILSTLALGTLLVGLDRTVVNLAVPKILSDFHTTISTVGWVSTVYLLTNSIFIPVFGKLSDLYGARRVYMWGFTGFTIVSFITGFSWSIGSLIFFRALQGLLGASVYPTAMALIALNFKDPEKRGEALGSWTSIIAASVVIGPLIGGPLIDKFSWPAAFFINLPVGIIALIMALRYLPRHEHIPTNKPFDFKGATSFALGLLGILLVLDRGVEWGWTSPLVITLASASILCFGAFFFFERRDEHPFIPLKFLKNRVLLSTLLVSLVVYGTLFGFMYIFSLYAQQHLMLSATSNGLLLLPLLIGVSVLSPVGGKMLKKYRPHVPVIGGLILSCIGMGSIAAFYYSPNHIFLIIALALIGAGIGCTSAPLSTTATTSVKKEFVGFASSLLNLTRNIAGVIFIAILTILLSMGISYQWLFAICAVAALCTLIPSIVLKRNTTPE